MTKILSAVIVDDEPLAHDVIIQYAKELENLDIIDSYYSPIKALKDIPSKNVDIVFLDINMPVIKGLDLLELLPTNPIVIVTSAHQEYALKGYDLDVCDYLLKPFRFERFVKAVQKAHKWAISEKESSLERSANLIENKTNNDAIFVKVDRKNIRVLLSDIEYLEAYGNYVKLWVNGNCLLTPRTLISFVDELCNSLFVRVHKSYIINKSSVLSIENNSITLDSNTNIPIGKSFKNTIPLILGC